MKHILDRTSFAELRELFERAQKAKEYARHNPPMEKRTTRFICRLGRGAVLMSDNVLFTRDHTRFVKTLLPKVVQALMDTYEAFRTDAIRFDRNVRYARNEYKYPLAEYGFRRTASVLALSILRKENNGIMFNAET